MATTIQDLVITHLQDAYAMEQNVLGMLDSMISTTDDPQIKTLLQNHRAETVEHGNRVESRLKQLGHSTSMTKTAVATVGGMFKMATDMLRSEKACKNLRDGFITEHGEIAGYELLERYANRANDPQTAAVARQSKAEEVAMASRLKDLWDRAVDLDLHSAGIQKDAAGTQTGSFGKRSDAAERDMTWTGNSADADMGIGLHGDTTSTRTQTDQLEANIPQSTSTASTQTSIPRNP